MRTADTEDRRVCRVSLSDVGRGWMDADRQRRRDWLTDQIRRLHVDDVDRLSAAVEVIEGLTTS